MCQTMFRGWMAHLCGLCLTLRDEHGHAARLVTNYDGLLVSVLVEAQRPARAPRRRAGPCALRGFKTAEVTSAHGEGARLAAATSLILAAAKIKDHVADRDGVYARGAVAALTHRVAGRWAIAGGRTSAAVGFDAGVLTDAVDRQARLESATGLSLLEVTEPTETAVAAAFGHTAQLAGKPDNAEPASQAGRMFGRIAHLIDAVEDLDSDRAGGAYNPLPATGTTLREARQHCDAAADALESAVTALDLDDPGLTKALLTTEVRRTVDRTFAGQREPATEPRPRRAGLPVLCLAGSLTACTCGLWRPPWSPKRGEPCSDRCCCDDCSCDCCDCCDCCSCCDCSC
jgi:hypothetical protein